MSPRKSWSGVVPTPSPAVTPAFASYLAASPESLEVGFGFHWLWHPFIQSFGSYTHKGLMKNAWRPGKLREGKLKMSVENLDAQAEFSRDHSGQLGTQDRRVVIGALPGRPALLPWLLPWSVLPSGLLTSAVLQF